MPHAATQHQGDADAVAVVQRPRFESRPSWLAGRHVPQARRAPWLAGFGRARFHGVRRPGLPGFAAQAEGSLNRPRLLAARHDRGIGSALTGVSEAGVDTLQSSTILRSLPARRFGKVRGFTALHATDGGRNGERQPAVPCRRSRRDG